MNRSMKTMILLTALLVVAGLTACKSSGTAVSDEGHIINVDIAAPHSLPEGQTDAMTVEIANRGFNKLQEFEFDVEMPIELIVVSQTQSPGVDWTERVTESGTKLYRYEVNEINVGGKAEVRFHVRTAFGASDRTGDIRVTAHSEELPGGRLVQSKNILLAR